MSLHFSVFKALNNIRFLSSRTLLMTADLEIICGTMASLPPSSPCAGNRFEPLAIGPTKVLWPLEKTRSNTEDLFSSTLPPFLLSLLYLFLSFAILHSAFSLSFFPRLLFLFLPSLTHPSAVPSAASVRSITLILSSLFPNLALLQSLSPYLSLLSLSSHPFVLFLPLPLLSLFPFTLSVHSTGGAEGGPYQSLVTCAT